MKRLVVIDGNAILHRAFHALPPLTAPDGSVVNAVYGFTSMLLKIINDFQPAYLAVAFDRPAPTFRKKIFKEYQAKRPKMDDDLVPQVGKVHELLTAFGIPMYEKDGYEADDVIGTITKKAHSLQFTVHSKTNIEQVIIITGDKDILQLVEDERVLVFMPTKGLSEGKLYGEKEVEDRMGVVPKLIPDLKALAGDQSDNYPGIPGVGPKTAIDLLKQFRSMENLYKGKGGNSEKWGSLRASLVNKIQEGKESAIMSKELATIHKDVPIDISSEQMIFTSINTPAAVEMLEKLGFRSVIKRLSSKNRESVVVRSREKKKTGKRKDTQQSLFENQS